MHPDSVSAILGTIKPSDVVLDIGGWACPFNRANYVMDAEPYETRGYYGRVGGTSSQGGEIEFFSERTWIRRDICGREPYPFRDKEIDFVICSHTLEDVRDPLWVCSEMVRIAKRGYIEVPSRLAESCRGWESARQAGLSHHRWLIEVGTERPAIIFMMKYHMINSHWRFSFPPSFLGSLSPDQRVIRLFWNGTLDFSERIIHGLDNITSELESFVAKVRPYPDLHLRTDRAKRRTNRFIRRAWRVVQSRAGVQKF